MKSIKISEAKIHLSSLVDQAASGEPFIIAKRGRDLVKVVALTASGANTARRIGFMAGRITVPDDFDRMGAEELEAFGSDGLSRQCLRDPSR